MKFYNWLNLCPKQTGVGLLILLPASGDEPALTSKSAIPERKLLFLRLLNYLLENQSANFLI